MRLVAVSIVKNEADIIEPFIRHTRHWVDEHLVFDHQSTDGTREILGKLIEAGLPLRVFTDDEIGNLQQRRSNYLSRLAAEEGADWVLPLDADEIISGPGRLALEDALGKMDGSAAASVRHRNYWMVREDDEAVANPLVRLQYCDRSPSETRKILVARSLALNAAVCAGKGSHALYVDGRALPDQPLPPAFYYSHLSARTLGQQAIRIVQAELQKLSQGAAHEGVDTHYRLGFQLLKETPERFAAFCYHDAKHLEHRPIRYQGGALQYDNGGTADSRVLRAILPYLDRLATSHGRLLDQVGVAASARSEVAEIRRLATTELTAMAPEARVNPFQGYEETSGFGPAEGPVPEAWLSRFHWGYYPESVLRIGEKAPRQATLQVECLTYSEGQSVVFELNGQPVHTLRFGRVNQLERVRCQLALVPGENRLTFRYGTYLQTTWDVRKLAVIFLALRIA